MRSLAVKRVLTTAFFVVSVFVNHVQAGGYLRVTKQTDGTSRVDRWDASQPIVYNLDRGPLGKYSKQQADAMIANAFAKWSGDQIATSALRFQRGADLAEDHGDGIGSDPNYAETSADGITPVIYDQAGRITAGLYGGAEKVTIGFAGPRWIRSSTGIIREGRAVFNGLFCDNVSSSSNPGDISQESLEGVFVHEIGHILNLDHSSINEAAGQLYLPNGIPGSSPDTKGVPTMYPLIHSGSLNLELDDKAWISNLYPSAEASQTNTLGGTVLGPDGKPLNGVNMVARFCDDPSITVSCVSGYNDATGAAARGQFVFPALPAYGRWVVDFEQIGSRFTGGSLVGPIDPPIRLTSPVEWVNEPGVESSNDNPLISTTFSPGGPGAKITDLVARLNQPSPDFVVNESDPAGNAFPQDAQRIALAPGKFVINGNVAMTEGGTQTMNGSDQVEDWYLIAPPAGVEIRRITLQPTQGDDMDFSLVTWPGSGKVQDWITRSRAGAGAAETAELSLDTTLVSPNSAYAGQFFLGVSGRNVGGNYRLEIESTPSDLDAVVISNTWRSGAGALHVYGRGFKNQGGVPAVTFSSNSIYPYDIIWISSRELFVGVLETGAVPKSVTTQVVNMGASGSYGGRYTSDITFDSPLPGLLARLLNVATYTGDKNSDRVVDAADLTWAVGK